MKPENPNRSKQLLIEFVKSGAMLLLAIVLLISAVFAWFGDMSNFSIATFLLSVKSGDGGNELSQDIITFDSTVLPCVTKLGDSTISVSDFAKAIKIISVPVEASNHVDITFEKPAGVHYYIDVNYVGDKNSPDFDSAENYANLIFTEHEKSKEDTLIDKNAVLMYNDADNLNKDYPEKDPLYRHMVAIVLWADYDYKDPATNKTYGETIDAGGSLSLNVIFGFKTRP